MTVVPVEAVRGAVWVSADTSGVSIDRLPPDAQRRYSEIRGLREASTQASGVRLELRTAATWLELDLKITRFLFDPAQPDRPAVLVATVDGQRRDEVRLDAGALHLFAPPDVDRVLPGKPETARFLLGDDGGDRVVTLWLPHTAAVKLFDLRGDSEVAAAPRTAPRWTHYGSSISHCIEARTPLDVWPVAAALELGLDLTSLAIAGQAHLDPFAADAIATAPADLISLEVGINIVAAASMRERTFIPAVHGFLDSIRSQHQTTPILLIAPISCPALEDRPGPMVSDGTRIKAPAGPPSTDGGLLTLRHVRDLLHDVVISRGESSLRYVDGRDLFGPADVGHLTDGVHPDSEGYRLLGRRFVSEVRRRGWAA